MNEWKTIKNGSRIEIGLLQIDIAGHSKFKDSDKILAETKVAFHQQIEGIVRIRGGKQLNWAGDGGSFMFLTTNGNVFNDMTFTAIQILNSLPAINDEIVTRTKFTDVITVRISCDSGMIDYSRNSSTIFTTADWVNKFLKNEREISHNNSIVITERVRKQLDAFLKNRFHEFKYSEEVANKLYIYKGTEIEKIFKKRSDINPQDWREFYQTAKSELDVMGHSMLSVFKNTEDRQIIHKLLENGCTIRVLLLNPFEHYVQQMEETNRGLSFELKEKIQKTLESIGEIKSLAQSRNYQGKLIVKVTNETMYCAISKADDRMYVNPYSNNPEGDKCPTLLLRRTDEGLFRFYEEEFKRMWNTGYYIKEIEPQMYINQRVCQYYDTAKKVKDIMDGKINEPLPLPKMVIIYPSYICSLRCPNCMYKDFRSRHSEDQIDVELFGHILNNLCEIGIENIELSGGGEPLEHKEIEKLLGKIVNIKKGNKQIKFGLLTNGLKFNDFSKDIIEAFIENFTYIRLSCPEDVPDNKLFESLDKLIKFSGKYPQDERARIGVKILVTKENKDKIENLIEIAYGKEADHVKIKSIRGTEGIEPDEDELKEIEERLYIHKFADPKLKDLQIDMRKTKFSPKFKCWINSLCPIIDPNGGVYICYNYHNDSRNMLIGTLELKTSLMDFWGKEGHIALIKGINTERICKAINSCNCRFVNYQEIIEKLMKYDEEASSLMNTDELYKYLLSVGLRKVGSFL